MPATNTYSASRRTRDGTGVIRPFVRGDVEAVARLFNRAFRKTDVPASRPLRAFFEDVFFDAPCQVQSSLCSYVYERDGGGIGGFVGTHPRELVFDGRAVTAAAYGQLMIDPALRGQGIARRLVERFYAGGQAYSFCGSAAPATRAINARLGGIHPASKGLSWHKTLRPIRAAAQRLARARKLGPLRHVAAAFAKPARSFGAAGPNATPDVRAIESVHERAFHKKRFHAAFNADHVSWALRTAGASPTRTLQTSVVDVGDGPDGWYVFLLDGQRRATVVELLCVPGRHRVVVAAMMKHAHAAGAQSIGGLCHDAEEAAALRSAGASIFAADSTFVFHSRSPDLITAFPEGPAHLSAFDGEGWVDFPD